MRGDEWTDVLPFIFLDEIETFLRTELNDNG
jgi:hypothetical protein